MSQYDYQSGIWHERARIRAIVSYVAAHCAARAGMSIDMIESAVEDPHAGNLPSVPEYQHGAYMVTISFAALLRDIDSGKTLAELRQE